MLRFFKNIFYFSYSNYEVVKNIALLYLITKKKFNLLHPVIKS